MPGGLQFLIVTHSKSLSKYADKCFKVEQKEGVSFLEEVVDILIN